MSVTWMKTRAVEDSGCGGPESVAITVKVILKRMKIEFALSVEHKLAGTHEVYKYVFVAIVYEPGMPLVVQGSSQTDHPCSGVDHEAIRVFHGVADDAVRVFVVSAYCEES